MGPGIGLFSREAGVAVCDEAEARGVRTCGEDGDGGAAGGVVWVGSWKRGFFAAGGGGCGGGSFVSDGSVRELGGEGGGHGGCSGEWWREGESELVSAGRW